MTGHTGSSFEILSLKYSLFSTLFRTFLKLGNFLILTVLSLIMSVHKFKIFAAKFSNFNDFAHLLGGFSLILKFRSYKKLCLSSVKN